MSGLDPTQIVAARTAIAVVAALAGALIGISTRRMNHRLLCGLVSFAAGALLSVTITHIVPESADLAGGVRAGAGLLVGLALFSLLGKYIYFVCPACSATASDEDKGFLRLGVLLIAALSIHSTMDGLAIAAGSQHEALRITGYLILLAVSYHKVPEGLALASVARLAGLGRLKSLGITLLVELTTALGALIGVLAVGHATGMWLGIVLGFVGGSFLYIVGFAVIKEMFEHEQWSIFGWTAAGFSVMLIFGRVFEGMVVH